MTRSARELDDVDPGHDDAPVVIIRAPARARVVLTCPDCQGDVSLEASLFARRTRDSDGTTTLSLRTRAPKIAHDCGQLTIDGALTGSLVR